jgi:hypothetical protein
VLNETDSKDRELVALGQLCRSLAKLGFGVQLRDALPGLTVTRSQDTAEGTAAYVVISRSGHRFTWWRVDNSHPISDVDGAAQHIADFVQEQRPAVGEL